MYIYTYTYACVCFAVTIRIFISDITPEVSDILSGYYLTPSVSFPQTLSFELQL